MSPKVGPQESVLATVLFFKLQGSGCHTVGAQQSNQHMCVSLMSVVALGQGWLWGPPWSNALLPPFLKLTNFQKACNFILHWALQVPWPVPIGLTLLSETKSFSMGLAF